MEVPLATIKHHGVALSVGFSTHSENKLNERTSWEDLTPRALIG
jgi:hypothetical protein